MIQKICKQLAILTPGKRISLETLNRAFMQNHIEKLVLP